MACQGQQAVQTRVVASGNAAGSVLYAWSAWRPWGLCWMSTISRRGCGRRWDGHHRRVADEHRWHCRDRRASFRTRWPVARGVSALTAASAVELLRGELPLALQRHHRRTGRERGLLRAGRRRRDLRLLRTAARDALSVGSRSMVPVVRLRRRRPVHLPPHREATHVSASTSTSTTVTQRSRRAGWRRQRSRTSPRHPRSAPSRSLRLSPIAGSGTLRRRSSNGTQRMLDPGFGEVVTPDRDSPARGQFRSAAQGKDPRARPNGIEGWAVRTVASASPVRGIFVRGGRAGGGRCRVGPVSRAPAARRPTG